MSSSGLIYAVIVGAWAAYLVPMWLRRQDELNEARPTERFSTAIRLLSGRAAMERRYAKARDDRAAAPAGDEPVDVRGLAEPITEVMEPVEDRSPLPQPPTAPRPLARGRAKLLARRRRTITILFLAFTAGAIAAAVGGLAYLWAPAAPGILLSTYIGYLRRQERHRFELAMDQRRAAEADRRPREHAPSAAAEDAGPAATAQPSPRTADRRALVEQTDHAEWIDQQRDQSAAEEGWEPVPVPLPTYVTAPVAPRTHGHPDLAGPEHWSPARSGTAAEPERSARPPAAHRSRERTPLFDQYAAGLGDTAGIREPGAARRPEADRPRAANE